MRAFGAAGLGVAALVLAACGGDSGGGGPAGPSASACGTAVPSLASPGSAGWQLAVDGACRSYRLHVPPGLEPSRPVPLVVALHGNTGSGESMEASSGLSRTADGEGFLVAYPQGIGNAWDLTPGSRDTRFLRALVAGLRGSLAIDPRRVYVTGFSMGGGMANRAACDLPDVFAAAAPVSGAHQYSSSCSPARPVPVLGIHGASDSVVPLGGYAGVPAAADWIVGWATRNGCGSTTPAQSELSGAAAFAFPGCPASGETVLVVVPGLGHTWWPAANDAITSFFDRHALP